MVVTEDDAPAARSDAVLRVVRSALLILVVTGSVLAASSLATWRTLADERRQALDVTITSQLDLARLLIEKEYFEIAGDAAVAARAPGLVRFADTRYPDALRGAQGFLAEIVASYGRYPHARLLDTDGRELIRIDRVGDGSAVAPIAASRRGVHADLARAALDLPPGSLTVSGLAGNPEEDVGDVLPTVHFVVPVVDTLQRPIAVLVLDYDATRLLSEVAAVFATSPAEEVWLGPTASVFELPRDGRSLAEVALSDVAGPLERVAPSVAEAFDGGAQGPIDDPSGRLYATRTSLLGVADGEARPTSWATGRLVLAPETDRDAQWALAARVDGGVLAALQPWNDPTTRVQIVFVAIVVTLLSITAAWGFEALRTARRRAELDALTDALTGAANRRAFQADLQRDVARSARARQPLALVVLDLDRFKAINDRHGHAGGDAVLAAFVATAHATLRAGDGVYRIGGEEFALLLPGADRAAALQSVDRLRAAVAARPVSWHDDEIAYSASYGVVAAPPDALRGDAATVADGLLKAADQAAYAAKRGGRQRVETAEAPVPEGSARQAR